MKKTYQPIGKYPSLTRDISIAIPQATLYKDIIQNIKNLSITAIENIELIDFYKGPVLGEKKSYTLRLQLRDQEKTLTEKKVSKMLDKIATHLKKELGAVIRD